MGNAMKPDWKPIETAPFNEVVMLWNGSLSFGEREDPDEDFYVRIEGEFVWDGDHDRAHIVQVRKATHWDYLPEGPGVNHDRILRE
jgi:hypothetical protein